MPARTIMWGEADRAHLDVSTRPYCAGARNGAHVQDANRVEGEANQDGGPRFWVLYLRTATVPPPVSPCSGN